MYELSSVRNITVVGWAGAEVPVVHWLTCPNHHEKFTSDVCDHWINFLFPHSEVNETYSINIVRADPMNIHCLSTLPSDTCFNVVDGLILVVNHFEFEIICNSHCETIYYAFLHYVLDSVKKYGLKLVVVLNGMSERPPNPILKRFVEIVHSWCEHFSVDEVIVGNIHTDTLVHANNYEQQGLREHLLRLLIRIVPCPNQSFTYRMSTMDWSSDIPLIPIIQNSDMNGNLVIRGFKMIPSSKPGRFNLLCVRSCQEHLKLERK